MAPLVLNKCDDNAHEVRKPHCPISVREEVDAMTPENRETLALMLRRERARLWQEATGADSELRDLTESQESEFEEAAQRDRMARLLAGLDLRLKREIEEIDAALERIAAGTYGRCECCDEEIVTGRLLALPKARMCVPCAAEMEDRESKAPHEAEEAPTSAPVTGDLALLSDRDIEAHLRQTVREDGRIDTEELRIVCRHGIAYLDGAVPSAAEHQILRKLVSDVEGLGEIVDRLQVKELLWEREERTKAPPLEVPPGLASDTDDIVRSIEEGIGYTAPDQPPPEEE